MVPNQHMVVCGVVLFGSLAGRLAADDEVLVRCEVMPLPGQQVQLSIDGVEKLRWHAADNAPRPFFYPFNGPSGVSLTRMGHPGAQNHDHHRSVWFAHNKVNGIDFWSDNTAARIRQKYWYRYRDGNDEAVMAFVLGWYGPDGDELMEQDVVAAIIPMENNEHAVEIQTTLRPSANRESVMLEQTNFGLLAVRVSKTISAYFGGGHLTNSEGVTGEKDIFGKPARWMDYSGPVIVGTEASRKAVTEGITYFDHPSNPGYPSSWHVRDDGWMAASVCMHAAQMITADKPLTLRYLLHVHSGDVDQKTAEQLLEAFSARPGFLIRKPVAGEPHRQYEVERVSSQSDRN